MILAKKLSDIKPILSNWTLNLSISNGLGTSGSKVEKNYLPNKTRNIFKSRAPLWGALYVCMYVCMYVCLYVCHTFLGNVIFYLIHFTDIPNIKSFKLKNKNVFFFSKLKPLLWMIWPCVFQEALFLKYSIFQMKKVQKKFTTCRGGQMFEGSMKTYNNKDESSMCDVVCQLLWSIFQTKVWQTYLQTCRHTYKHQSDS